MECITEELLAYFQVRITAPNLAVNIAMAMDYYVGKDPESWVAKRLRKVRILARDRLAPHIAQYYRNAGLKERDVQVVVDMALGISDRETAQVLGITPAGVRSRRSRLRASNETVRNTFPAKRLKPDLNELAPAFRSA
jgi:DNA-binding NarL/FixJ family response regulator